MNPTRPRPLTPFGMFFGATPVLPSLYWDVYSAEQRWKAIAEHLKKLCEYAEYLSGEVNIDRDTINQLLDEFQQFKESGFEDYYEQQLEAWVNANVANIFEQYAKLVMFGLDDEGHFVAYVPESWSDIWFDTIADYNDPLYGSLVLLWDGNGDFSNPVGPTNMPTNYESLSFKPSINGVTLIGDRSFAELGLVPMTEQEVIDA